MLPQGYTNCLVTPNVAEVGRLAKALGVPLEGQRPTTAWQQCAPQLAQALQGPIVVGGEGLGSWGFGRDASWGCAEPRAGMGMMMLYLGNVACRTPASFTHPPSPEMCT